MRTDAVNLDAATVSAISQKRSLTKKTLPSPTFPPLPLPIMSWQQAVAGQWGARAQGYPSPVCVVSRSFHILDEIEKMLECSAAAPPVAGYILFFWCCVFSGPHPHSSGRKASDYKPLPPSSPETDSGHAFPLPCVVAQRPTPTVLPSPQPPCLKGRVLAAPPTIASVLLPPSYPICCLTQPLHPGPPPSYFIALNARD
jgi:hypothetical protein